MRTASPSLASIGTVLGSVLGITLGLALVTGTAGAQTAPTRDDIVGKLNHLETASDVDLAAL